MSAIDSAKKQNSRLVQKQAFEAYKNFWALVGPIVAVVGASAYWSPSVVISAGTNIDPTQTLQTDLLITNTGHLPVYNVRFQCAIIASEISHAELANDFDRTLKKIEVLSPSMPIARQCFTVSRHIVGAILRITAFYEWPFSYRKAHASGFFAVRESASGFFLEPEAPTDSQPLLVGPPLEP